MITTIDVPSYIKFKSDKALSVTSSGTSIIVLAFRDVYIFDPFTGHMLQEIKLNTTDSNRLINYVKLDWCTNEMILFYEEHSGKQFGNVLKFKTEIVESLFISSLKAVLLSHSINDLVAMNLPKSIKKYFVD